MTHALVIMDAGNPLVVTEVNSHMRFLLQDEIDDILDEYAEQYAYPREFLTGVYLPMVDVKKATEQR